jgi:fructokinase
MFVACGESLMDVYEEARRPGGVLLDARIGGSPFNVAIGLARLGQRVGFLGALSRGFLGVRLRDALRDEGVDLRYATDVDAPTTLGLVGLDAGGSASYAFYGQGCADRLLDAAALPTLGDEVRALHFGSFSMVVEPVGSALRLLVERERAARLIAYDPNLRLNVVPDLAVWRRTVSWMAERAHLVKVSAEDLALLEPGEDADRAAKCWLDQGVALVVVTCGGDGARAFTRSASVSVAARPARVVDTVGAGDSFQAALLAWLAEQGLLTPAALRGLGAPALRAALEFAATAAAVTCTRRGADMPRRDELARVLGGSR